MLRFIEIFQQKKRRKMGKKNFILQNFYRYKYFFYLSMFAVTFIGPKIW